jgi:signal peptidase II
MACAILVLFCDAFTKRIVVDFFPLYSPGHSVFSNCFGIDFELTHATNTGAAWGLFSNIPNFLIVLRIVLIIGLIGYLAFFNTHPSFRLPLILIISGALGNIIDFFVYGHVVDMFHFTFFGYDYPVFNVADSAIFLGTISILWIVLREKEKNR